MLVSRVEQETQTRGDYIGSLATDLLHHLLSFVPNSEFYVSLPSINHRYHELLLSPQLHQSQCQRRFRMSQADFNRFKSAAWPCLTSMLDYSSAMEARRIAAMQEHSLPHVPVQKDWCTECHHLFKLCSTAEGSIFKFSPRTRYGDRHRLPYYIQSYLIDSLTSRYLSSCFVPNEFAGYHTFLFDETLKSRLFSSGIVASSFQRLQITFADRLEFIQRNLAWFGCQEQSPNEIELAALWTGKWFTMSGTCCSEVSHPDNSSRPSPDSLDNTPVFRLGLYESTCAVYASSIRSYLAKGGLGAAFFIPASRQQRIMRWLRMPLHNDFLTWCGGVRTKT